MAPARAFLAIPKGDKACPCRRNGLRGSRAQGKLSVGRRKYGGGSLPKRAIRADSTDLVSTILARYLNGL
jgi:hypothetical protein